MEERVGFSRADLRRRIEVLAASCDQCRLVGSWAYGDFHFSLASGTTLSDVDVHCSPKCALGEFYVAVPGLLSPVRVSRRSEDYAGGIDLADSNLLASFLLAAPSAQSQWDYVAAKVALLWLRESVEERYKMVAERVGTAATQAALARKLGIVDGCDLAVCEPAMDHIASQPWSVHACRLIRARGGDCESVDVLARMARDCVKSVSGAFVEAMISKAR